jgi:predicted metal-dependent hydrolase
MAKTLTYEKELSFQGRKINYLLKIREQKNIVLRLQNDEIVVSAPFYANEWEIEQIIYKNIRKIEAYLKFIDTVRKRYFNSRRKKRIQILLSSIRNDERNRFKNV